MFASGLWCLGSACSGVDCGFPVSCFGWFGE